MGTEYDLIGFLGYFRGTRRMSMSDGSNELMRGRCVWCDHYHDGPCPRIKAIEYFENGMVKRVEFHEPPRQNYVGPL